MQKKTATGMKVNPTGDFVGNIVIELVRRMISGGEKIKYLMEELDKRFGKLDPTTVYSILSQLQQLGFDISPNDFLFFTPVEHRAALLSVFLKSGKNIGSRTEDINECIKECSEELNNINVWLRENDKAKVMSPNVYAARESKKCAIEKKIESLRRALSLSKSAVLYSFQDKSNTPLVLLGFNIGNSVKAVLRTAQDDIAMEDVKNLSETSPREEMMKDVAIPEADLFKEFKQLAMSGDPLKTFYESYQQEDFTEPTTKLGMEEYLADFARHIDTSWNTYESFTPENAEDALGQLKTFADDYGIKFDFNKDESIAPPEKVPAAAPMAGEAAPAGEMPPAATAKAAASKAEVKLADTLTYFDRIADLISKLRTATDITKTAEAEEALRSLNDSVDSIRFYVKEQLRNESEIEKEAAYVVLRNIANDLQDIEQNFRGFEEKKFMPFVVASLIKKAAIHGKLMIESLGE